MAEPTTDAVLIEVVDPEADAEQLDRLSRALRQELLGLDSVVAVRTASEGPAPEGTRGLDVAAIGSLVVSVAPTVEALGRIVGVLRAFLARPRSAPAPALTVTVNGETLSLSPTAEQQQALVDAFLARASTPA